MVTPERRSRILLKNIPQQTRLRGADTARRHPPLKRAGQGRSEKQRVGQTVFRALLLLVSREAPCCRGEVFFANSSHTDQLVSSLVPRIRLLKEEQPGIAPAVINRFRRTWPDALRFAGETR